MQPSIMKNKYRILKILITLIIFGFLLSFSLKRFSQKTITKEMISVKLNEASTPVYFIDEKDVKNIVAKENPTAKVGTTNIPQLEKKIREIPAVDSANVYLNLNGNLNLDIKQRIPAFRLKKGERDFYVDENGVEFPTYRNYSHKCRLVSGNVSPEEYPQVIQLIRKIESDSFSKKYFVGIRKHRNDYLLLTNDGYFQVELGDLENIDFKINGFKTFVEKYLVYQDLEKYDKISLKYDNQIVTTLNPNYQGNQEALKDTSPKKETEVKKENTPKKEQVSAAKDTSKPKNTPQKKAEPKQKEPAKAEKKNKK